tara:strand:+ start:5961 stop:6311 length:351 start_codon:yes stop_codon:yes gene_type:complete
MKKFNIKEWRDRYLTETKAVKVKVVAKHVAQSSIDFADDIDDDNIEKFGKVVSKIVEKLPGGTVEWSEFEKVAIKANKKYKFKDTDSHMEPGGVLTGKAVFNQFMDQVKEKLFEAK